MADDRRGPVGSRDTDDSARLSLLGHDLRAAVADIIGGLRLIDPDRVDDATWLQLERVRTSGEVLSRLLEQGLAMMLGEDDFAATHPANLQMERFFYDLEMRWSGRAREKGLDFRVARCASVPQVLTIDRLALERVLSNILSNAIKYTDSGRVSLDASMADSGALRLTVTDEGPGFSADALSRLFEYNGRPDGTGKPGEGLGMHITRDMAGRLGATISVENLARQGARITLDVPPDRWTIATPDEVVRLPDLSRTKVLVAEDNKTNQMILSHMLGKMSAQFEIAEDGVEALQWFERENFDLALIDIEMPRLNGLDVIRSLRAHKGVHARMPIIAVTAYVLRSNRETIYAAGADAILVKPLSGIETFGRSIAQVLGRRAPQRSGGELPADPGEFDRSRFDRLLEIAGPEAREELLLRVRSDLGNCGEKLSAALAGHDFAAIRSETHVLIALAGALGAVALQARSQTLNLAGHRRDLLALEPLGRDLLALLDRLLLIVDEALRSEGRAS